MIHEMGSKGLRPVWKLEGSGMIDGEDEEVLQVALQVGRGRDMDNNVGGENKTCICVWKGYTLTKGEAHTQRTNEEMRVKYQMVCGVCRMVRAEVKTEGRSDGETE